MTDYRMVNPHIKGSQELTVPDTRVQKFQSKGWVLAEGQDFQAPKEKKGRVIPVDESLAPKRNEDQGVDTGRPLPEGAVVKQDGSLVDHEGKVPFQNLPGLTGKSKEVMLGIAKAENIEVDASASKPNIKLAIENARAARDGNPVGTVGGSTATSEGDDNASSEDAGSGESEGADSNTDGESDDSKSE